MVVTLSCLARSTARSLGIPEPVIKQARRKPYRVNTDDPKFCVVYTLVPGTERALRLNCCHHDHGQIVSLSEA